MIGRLPLLHGGSITLDEIAVWVGFALIIGLITHWIDYRAKARRRLAGEHPEDDERQEDGGSEGVDLRGQPGLDEVDDRVTFRDRDTVERLP